MNQELPPGQDQQEIEGLAMLVAENLNKGENPDGIEKQLVENGWEEQDAHQFVKSIQHQLAQARQQQRSGGGGWLVWIGVILGINLLSYLFNWGFFLW